MIGDVHFPALAILAAAMLQHGVRLAQPIQQPATKHLVLGHLIELVLDRRAAAVEHQDLRVGLWMAHGTITPSY